jgi:hypothetical protein
MPIEKRTPNFPCPHCGHRSWVNDSRPATLGGAAAVRRRRTCTICNRRWTTWETLISASTLERRINATARAVSIAIAALENVRLEIVQLTVSDEDNDQPGLFDGRRPPDRAER